MNAEQLKALQAPLKDRYRSDPTTACATLCASGRVDLARIAVEIDRPAGASLTPGLHPMAGGDGTFACAAEMLLEALIGCAGVTFAAVCTAMAIDMKQALVRAEGDVDFRGTLGVDRATPVGFTAVRIHFTLDSAAPEATLEKAVQLAERYCVVAQTLKSVEVGWTRAGS
jgi:uncharacterized OsmC-like protein